MDLEHLEALALAGDRAAALAGLLPGTVDHDYWRGVHLQHEGRLAEVDTILADWWGRHREQGELYGRLERRQLLLRAGEDLAAHADTLRLEAGLRLDDQAEAEAAAQRYPTRLDLALVESPALIREALSRAADLSYLTDWSLPELVERRSELDAVRRRDLLRRLPRANTPGVVDLIAGELADPSSRGLGALRVSFLLTLAQLAELGALLPALCQGSAWADAVVARLRPPVHADWQTDPDARRAYLDHRRPPPRARGAGARQDGACALAAGAGGGRLAGAALPRRGAARRDHRDRSGRHGVDEDRAGRPP